MNKVNVYGSFTQALFFSGMSTVPKLLLTQYRELGLSDQELILIIQILSELNTTAYPAPELLAVRMGTTPDQMEERLARLAQRKFMAIEKKWNPEAKRWVNAFNFVGLIEELADRWAIEKMLEFKRDDADAEAAAAHEPGTSKSAMERLVTVFEQELGRPLTGLECEHITHWLAAHFSEELIIEALRRGVSAGIRNFRYLDSILREWEKKGFRSRAEVEADDANFQTRQEKKAQGKSGGSRKSLHNPDKYENFYL